MRSYRYMYMYCMRMKVFHCFSTVFNCFSKVLGAGRSKLLVFLCFFKVLGGWGFGRPGSRKCRFFFVFSRFWEAGKSKMLVCLCFFKVLEGGGAPPKKKIKGSELYTPGVMRE